MNVIGYIRVSTTGQAKEGYSLSYQEDEIKAYCQAQGWNLLKVFSDAGISGAKVDESALEVDRPAFQDMLCIEQPTYSIMKRDPSDFLINGLMELLDAYQRLEIAMKLGRGRNKKAQQGGYAGGRAAFGYKAVRGSKMIVPDEQEVVAVQRIFELKELFPNWSLSEISKQLTYDRIADNGKPFSKMKIKRIIDRKDFYHGIYRYGDVEAVGQHTAIIQ